MRYLALCCDYDGTIAHHGRVDEATLAALTRLRESGRRLVLVTGRELDELQIICPHLDLFERVVAENGALLYRPSTREERHLAEKPPQKFAAPTPCRTARPPQFHRGMRRMIGRAIAWIFFALALFAAGRDGLLFLETGVYNAVTLGLIWHQLHSDSLQLIQPAIERHIHPFLWQEVLFPLLLAPAWAVLLGGAVVFGILFGRRRQRKWRTGSLG